MKHGLAVAAGALVIGSLIVGASAASGTARRAGVQPSSAGVTAAAKMVAAGEAPARWLGPYQKIDVSKLRGKTIWYINLDQSIPHLNAIGQALSQAAAKAGVKVVQFDGKSQVKEWQRGFEQAVAAKANVIVPLAVPLNAISAPLQDARKAGIPVVAALYTDTNVPLPAQFRDIAKSQVTEEYVKAGQLEAAWVVKDSKGAADVLVFYSPELAVTAPVVAGIKQVFAKTCPACKITWKALPVSQWSTQLSTLTRTSVTSDPHLNYIIPIYDGMANFIIPALHQAGASSRVKLSTYNATTSVMQALKRKDVVGADSGTQGPWEGWALADASFRAMLGAPPVANYKIPLRLFTANNINQIDLSKSEASWYGPVDFAGDYLKLWGLSK